MLLRNSPNARRLKRPGKVLVLFVLLLPALLGILGLVIDGGLMMAVQRQTQNAADAAATAAAVDLLNGKSASTLQSTANTYAKTYNGLTSATVTLHNPPTSGPYQGNSHYVEALVSYPVSTLFIQVLGVNPSQTVTARAVAGYEPVSAGEGVAVLNPNAYPGLSVGGNSTLKVNGRVIVNSLGRGVDQNGNAVNLGVQQGPAASASNGGTLLARTIEVVGGVDNPANFQNYDTPGGPTPLSAGNSTPEPDPLQNIATPYTGNGVQNQFWKQSGNATTVTNASSPQDISVTNGQTLTLKPGVYSSIKITGGTVNFISGIYVIAGNKGGGALTINGGTVTSDASGVMFYNTTSAYSAASATDSDPNGNNVNAYSTSAPNSASAYQNQFGGINITGGTVNLAPISDVNSQFSGMLFYQPRTNTGTIKLAGGSGTTINLAGTLYAQWGNFAVSGQSTYNAQFVAGSMSVTGGGVVTINYAGKKLGKANTVFLVE
jgi:Flp pilus assembly protein TadG